MKDNTVYGYYHRLEDALYERDRLISVDWDWDLAVELPETKNEYNSMYLPSFTHNYKYITSIEGYYRVSINRIYVAKYNDEEQALAHAKRVGGRVDYIKSKYRVQKNINGVIKSFGTFHSLEEAQAHRDELIKNNWKLM